MTTKKTTALAVPSLLADPARFEHAQRVGKMIALSSLFPKHLREGGADVAMANAVLVQDMADRLSRPPMEVAQNIYFVSGKPGWSTSYLIGLANESGKLKKTINWEVAGAGDTLSVKAFAELQSGAKVEYTVTMEMAKAEGWTSNKKYRTMPELMLRYRSATALIRLYMPEITMGVPAQEEVLDEPTMRDITPQTSSAPADTGEIVSETVDGEIMRPEETPKAKAKPKAKPKPKPETEAADDVEEVAGEAEPENGGEAETPHDPETGEVKDEPSAEDVDRHAQLKEMILSEIDACEDADMLDGVLDMYGPQIEQLKDFDGDLGDEIDNKATEHRAQLTE
ncbi:hypothetical protein [uncultured Planktomarina sp.]|mgnify:CR=1 FL=1|uniref:hypothetical protein n=1 Tax=uncultured Planktomarina sp. TaxID=1538529 RepID=UPI00325FEC56